MIKKYFYLFITFFCTFGFSKNILSYTSSRHCYGANPNNVIIYWDIHDTLLDPCSEFYTLKRKLRGKLTGNLLKNIFTFRWTGCLTGIKLCLDAKKRNAGGAYTENQLLLKASEYREKAEKTPKNRKQKKYLKFANQLESYAEIIGQFETSFELKSGIMPFLNTLKRIGYKQHFVASNISNTKYPLLKAKLPMIFNDTMIKDGVTVDVEGRYPFVQKPDHMFFKKMHKLANPNYDKIVVFIDDKIENVIAARKCNMIGIHFKSIRQLTKELNAIGIFMPITHR